MREVATRLSRGLGHDAGNGTGQVLALVVHASTHAAHDQVGGVGDKKRAHEHGDDRKAVVIPGRTHVLQVGGGDGVGLGEVGLIGGQQVEGPVADERHSKHGRDDERQAHVGPELLAVGLLPHEEGAHGSQGAQDDAQRTGDRLVGTRADGEAAGGQPARQGAGDSEVGKQDAGKHHDEVREVVRTVLGDNLLDVVGALEALATHDPGNEQNNQSAEHDSEEQVERHGVVVEGMDRLDEARAGDERAEHDEDEREGGGEDGPTLHHVATTVHGEGVDHGDGDKPGEKRGVLDRVPAPIAAPTQADVSPHGTQADASGEEDEGEQGDALAELNPVLGGVVAHEGRDGIGERHSHAGIADEQRRRMDGHGPVLQQRVHAPGSCLTNKGASGLVNVGEVGKNEGVVARAEQHDGDEEQKDGHDDDECNIGKALRVLVTTPGDIAGKGADEESPGEKRAGTPCPQAGELVEPEERARVGGVLGGDVVQGDVVREEALDDDAAGQKQREHGHENADAAHAQGGGVLRRAGLGYAFTNGLARLEVTCNQQDDGTDGGREGNPQRPRANGAHSIRNHLQTSPYELLGLHGSVERDIGGDERLAVGVKSAAHHDRTAILHAFGQSILIADIKT